MLVNIYTKEKVLRAKVEPTDNSTQQHAIMEDNVLNLSFLIPEYIPLDVNDYIDFDGERFWMIEAYVPQQKSTVEWSYSPKFYGIESLIKRGLVLKLVDDELQPVFSLTAPAREHLALMVANMNRIFNTTDFKVGECVVTENLVIDYNGTYVNEGLSMLAESAGTEWWFDKGYTVNLTRCEHSEPLTLGYRNGLTKLERTTAGNVKFFTRLIPLGTTRNIDHSVYGHTRLQLPGGVKFIDKENIHQYGAIEHYEESAFSHIYPRRVGTISSVRTEEKIGQDGEPFTIYYFKDSGLDFDPNDYEIAGLVKQVSFQSGELNGRDFEVNYNSADKEFEIITQFPYSDGTQVPNESLPPREGDEYILWNITMPTEYYALAEAEYLDAVNEFLAENNLDKSVYKAPTDYIDIQRRGAKLVIGQRVRLESDQYFPEGYRDSRITKITRKVNQPTDMDIEISDVLSKGKITSLENSVSNIITVIEQNKAGLPDIIKTGDNTNPADTNLFSALRSMREFLNKNKDGEVVKGFVRFLNKLFIGENVIDSMTAGAGVLIDNGRIQMDRAEIRNSLTVLELIFNRLSAQEGDYSYSESGMIEKVEEIGENTYNLTLRKRWENDFTAFAANDIVYGIVNDLASGGDYYTSWLRILNVNTVANVLTAVMYPDAEVPGGKNYPPTELMMITRRGNILNEDRQGYWYISSYEKCICMLDGVDKPILEESNYSILIGRLKHLSIFDNLPINYKHTYIYCRGIAIQDILRVDYKGRPIKEEVFRGNWSSTVAASEEPYRNTSTEVHVVYYLGCKWMCLSDNTLLEPKWNSTAWALIEGNSELSCELYPTNGEYFYAADIDFILHWDVRVGHMNINEDIIAGDTEWTRESGDVTADNLWAVQHIGTHNDLHITNEDVGVNFDNNGVTFKVRIFVRDIRQGVRQVEEYFTV